MKIVKRISALVMVLVMVSAILVACTKKQETKNEVPEADYLEGVSESQVALFGDLNGTKLRIGESAVLDDWEADFYEQLTESTGMEIEMEPMSNNELRNKVSQAVASGDTRNYFDVMDIDNSCLLQSIYGNLIVPMDAYMDRTDPVWQYSYSDNTEFLAPDVFKVDGKTYGAPSHGFHETFIYYNRTYFQEVGAPDPYEEYYLKGNWTKETFLDVCEAVTKKNADGEVEIAAWATWNYFAFPTAFGNDCIAQNDKNKWEVIIDQPNGMAGLDLLYQCAINGWLDVKTSGYEEFVNRKIAMIIDKPSSAMGGTEAYSRMSDEIGIVPLPKLDNSQENYICSLNISGYAITACAQNPAGAAAYIYYHRVGEMRRDEAHPEVSVLRCLNEEAQERRKEYLEHCEFAVSMIEGLQGWYSGGARQQFLQKIFKDHQNPATIVDSMIPILRDCLRKTTG